MSTISAKGTNASVLGSAPRNWTPQSLVVEDAQPTKVVLTSDKANTNLVASDFTIAGFTVNSGSWSGSVYTLVLSAAVVYGDSLTVVYNTKSYSVTNNTTPYISAISVLTTSDTTQTVTLTIVGSGQDGASVEYSTDGINYSVKGTTATSTFNATDLHVGDTCYVRARCYKGSTFYAYSSTITTYVSTLLTALVDYWKLDEASGNATGIYGNVLTNNNAATYVAGVIKNGVSLGTGNTNKNLSKDSAFGMTYASSRSIVGWVNIISQPANGTGFGLLSLLFGTNPGNYTTITYRQNATVIQFTINGGGSGVYTVTLTPGTWHHIGVTWDQAGNAIKFYLDGVLRISDTAFSSDYHTLTTRFSVGNFNNGNFASAIMDEVGLYKDRILTLDNMQNLYNLGYGGYSFPFGRNQISLFNTAYCWFVRPRAVYNASVNKTWIGIGQGVMGSFTQQMLTVDNSTGALIKTTIGTVNQNDDHIEAAILVRASDNKLFTCYSEHSGAAIRHRISTNALDATAWGAEVTNDPNNPNKYTYPSCFQVVNGDIYIFYRENAGSGLPWWCYIKSTDDGATFGAETKFSDKTYHQIYQNPTNKDIIHFVASMHPQDYTTPNSVLHYYFNAGDNTWHKSDGTDISAHLPLNDTYGTVIRALTNPEQSWIEDIILDSNGYPRVLLTYYTDALTVPVYKYLYYSEWNGSSWSTPYQIHLALTRSVMQDSTQDQYPPLACFDRGNPNRIFASKEVSGICEIFAITRNASNDFTSVQKTFNSTYDQWRPFSVNAVMRNVYWLNKVYYKNYTDLNEQLICDTL